MRGSREYEQCRRDGGGEPLRWAISNRQEAICTTVGNTSRRKRREKMPGTIRSGFLGGHGVGVDSRNLFIRAVEPDAQAKRDALLH